MPEGFSSIADLKVIVDANTEKFHSGIQGVNGVLDTLQKTSGQSLGGIDGLLQMVGTTSLTVSGKVKMAMAAVEAGIAIYQQFAQEGRAAAEALGVTTEYDKLIGTIDDLGMNIKDAAVGAFFALTSAGSETADTMMSFASSTDTATDSAEGFAAKLLTRVTQALDGARLQLRLWNSELAGNAGQINQTVDLLDARLQNLRVELAKMQSGETPSTSASLAGRNVVTRDLEKGLLDEINKLESARNDLLAKRATLPGADWAAATITTRNLLNDEIEGLQKRNATLGMSAGAAAEYNMMQKMIADATHDGIALGAEQMASMRKEAAEYGRLVQVQENFTKAERDSQAARQRSAQTERTETSIFANAERELMTLNQRARALNMNASEAAALNMQERLLQQLRTAGIPLDDGQIVRINAISAAYREQALALEEQSERMRDISATGDIVANGMRSAFANWTDGAKLDVKNMVASMLADLAQLTFQRNVIDTLFGGGGGGGSDGGGAFGAMLGSIFGGARADGGDVASGKAYLVGERGPELFLPGKSGTIIPNGGGMSAQPVQIITTIDARGATPDAVAELRQMMAQRDASLPSQVLSVMQNARDRVLA